MNTSREVPDIKGEDIDPRLRNPERLKPIARCSMLAFGDMKETEFMKDPDDIDNWLVEAEGEGACPIDVRVRYEAAGMLVEDEDTGTYVVYRRPGPDDEV